MKISYQKLLIWPDIQHKLFTLNDRFLSKKKNKKNQYWNLILSPIFETNVVLRKAGDLDPPVASCERFTQCWLNAVCIKVVWSWLMLYWMSSWTCKISHPPKYAPINWYHSLSIIVTLITCVTSSRAHQWLKVNESRKVLLILNNCGFTGLNHFLIDYSALCSISHSN